MGGLMRAFVQGNGPERKYVCIEIQGRRMAVVSGKAGGSPKRQEKDLASEDEAKAAGERMAREMLSRGFVEQRVDGKLGPTRTKAAPPRPPVAEEPEYALEALDEREGSALPPLLRALPTRETAGRDGSSAKPDKPKKKKKKRKKKSGEPEGKKDWVVLVGVSGI